MRVGRKSNVVETKKTRSCVVRLEKLSHDSISPTPSPTNRKYLNTVQKGPQKQHQQKGGRETTKPPHHPTVSVAMGATPKQPATAAASKDVKHFRGPLKKRPVGGNSTPQTPQQKQINVSALRSNQKLKVIPRANRSVATPTTPVATTKAAATPVREETPTPTIAAGRSRRAIKPNPKYASEDMVTPKMVRNVGGASSTAKSSVGVDGKRRKASTSSDDFYNNNSDDDFDEDFRKVNSRVNAKGDKAYKVDEKEIDLDSDISDIEEQVSKRVVKVRGRNRKQDTPGIKAANTKPSPNQTPNSNIKRLFNTPSSTVRTAPTQLQQLRRSLQSANVQRNQNILAGSGSIAQKRKLADSQDSDSESAYTIARKQMLVTTSSGLKVRMPVRENSSANTPPANRHRFLEAHRITSSSDGKLSLNGGNRTIHSQLIEKRRIIESAKSSQDTSPKMTMRALPNRLNQHTTVGVTASKTPPTSSTKSPAAAQSVSAQHKTNTGLSITTSQRLLRTSSPKPTLRKDASTNSTKLLTTPQTTSSASAPTQQQQQQKKLPTLPGKPMEKLKSALASTVTNVAPLAFPKAVNSKEKPPIPLQPSSKSSPSVTVEDSLQLNEESPNSTMDDFETMPTFTIVNVNDIINKKGDVLITKSKSNSSSINPTVIEISESISLDEDDGGDTEDEDGNVINKKQGKCNKPKAATSLSRVNNKLSPPNNSSKLEPEKKKLPLARSSNNNEAARKQQLAASTSLPSSSSTTSKPQILNHRLGLRNNPRVTAKTTTPIVSNPDKPAPRILNSVVAKKTLPVKPMITNLDDSAEESFPLSLDEEETEDEAESKSFEQPEKKSQYPMDLDTDDTDSQNSEQDEPTTKALTPKNNPPTKTTTSTMPSLPVQRKKRPPNTPIVVTSNKKRILTPAAAKENSLAAVNQQVNDTKVSSPITPQTRKQPAEKVVISKQGDKIIKKITCFETWYVINMPLETKRQVLMKNQLDIPLIDLANSAKTINLPSELWNCKVTLYELSATTLAKSTFPTYTGDLEEYNISEEDRAKYQPSCVMFRRSIEDRQQSRMPYDRAVIFKNKTFSTNIEGKNIRLVGAPSIINSERDIEILLEVVDALTLQSDFVEYATMIH